MYRKSRLLEKLTILITIFIFVFTPLSVTATETEVIIEDPTPDSTGPVLQSLAISGKEVTPQNSVKVTANASDDLSGINDIYVYYKKPSNNIESIRLTLNQTTGKYEGTLTVGKYDEAGDWVLYQVTLRDKKDNNTIVYDISYSGNHSNKMDFSPYTIKVSGVTEQPDKTPPIINNFSVSAQQIKPGETIKVKADVTDLSGVKSVHVQYRSPTSNRYKYVYFSYNQATGKYEGDLKIDQYDELGEWKVNYIYAVDNFNNFNYLYNSAIYNSAPIGYETKDFSANHVIVSKTTPDLIGPTLDSFAISLEQVTKNAAVVKLTAQLTDELSGISHFYALYQKPTGRTMRVYFSLNSSTGKYVGQIPIDKYDELGLYKLTTITIYDLKDNSKTIYDSSYTSYYAINKQNFEKFHFTVRGLITIPPPGPFSLTFLEKKVELNRKQTHQLKLTLNMTDGQTKDVTLKSTGTIYTSSNPSAVKVDENGLITVAPDAEPGVVHINAENSKLNAEFKVLIPGEAAPKEYLNISPLKMSLSPGETKQLNVIASLMSGEQDVTLGSTGTVYSSSNSSVASVTQNGLIIIATTAKAGESAEIVVKYNGIEVKSYITVMGPPIVKKLTITPTNEKVIISPDKDQTVQLSVAALMSDGTSKDVTAGTSGTVYITSDSKKAIVDANGLVTIPANAAFGEVIIKAKNNKVEVQSKLIIDGEKLVQVKATPSSQTVHPGNELTLSVTGIYNQGEPKDLTAGSTGTIYESSSTKRAVVDEDGRITIPDDASYGIVKITVKNGTQSTQVRLTVEKDASKELVEIITTPASQTVKRGDSLALSVIGTYGNGTEKNLTAGSEGTTYVSSSTDRAMVDEDGRITIPDDASYGIVKITVKNGTQLTQVKLTVEKDASKELVDITTTPASHTVKRGDSLALSVRGTYANGTTKDITAGSQGTTYVSSSTGRAVVDEDGRITIPNDASYGIVKITVKNGTQSTQVKLTVGKGEEKELTNIAAKPGSETVKRGDSLVLSIIGTYGDGTEKDLTAGGEGTTYESSSTARAEVDTDGKVTIPANAPYGIVKITVKNGRQSTQVEITVEKDTSKELVDLAISPKSQTVKRGESLVLSIIGTYGDGTKKDLTAGSEGTTYKSSSTARAVVDSDGKVTIPANASYGVVKITIKNGEKSTQLKLKVEK